MCFVYVATTAGKIHRWLARWLECYRSLTYPHRSLIFASESREVLRFVERYVDDAILIEVEPYFPKHSRSRVFAITDSREGIRRVFCDELDGDMLLFIDSDVWFPPNTIERLLDLAADGYDVVYSRNVGMVFLARRRAICSVTFCTNVFVENPRIYLEEWAMILSQMKFINYWCMARMGFECIRIRSFANTWCRHRDNPMGIQ